MTDDLYFNISEMKLSITSLYIISDAPKHGIIWTENSNLYFRDIEVQIVGHSRPHYSHLFESLSQALRQGEQGLVVWLKRIVSEAREMWVNLSAVRLW